MSGRQKGFASPARIMAGSAGLLADLIGQKKSTQWALLSKKFYILKIYFIMVFSTSVSLVLAVHWPPHTLFGAVCEVSFSLKKVPFIIMGRKLYLSPEKTCT